MTLCAAQGAAQGGAAPETSRQLLAFELSGRMQFLSVQKLALQEESSATNGITSSTRLKNGVARVCRGERSLQSANFFVRGNISGSPQLRRRLL
jgi:hypothetical protein